MKKSRIIIPALAMIAFSMVASISGAVAWFTATRTASVSAGSYAVVKTSANLDCQVKPGLGTTASGNTATVGGVLTHASVNHKNGKVMLPAADGLSIQSEVALASASLSDLELGTDVASSSKIYAAITFELEFTINFGAVQSSDIGLFLNAETSSFSYDTSSTDEYKGFRMAFIAHDEPTHASSKNTVFADQQVASKCTYVASQAGYSTPTSYDADDKDLIDYNYSTSLPTAASASRADYLGTFAWADRNTSTNNLTLKFTVVGWYEGTDENIVDKGYVINQAVTATLNFSAINFAS